MSLNVLLMVVDQHMSSRFLNETNLPNLAQFRVTLGVCVYYLRDIAAGLTL